MPAWNNAFKYTKSDLPHSHVDKVDPERIDLGKNKPRPNECIETKT